MSVRIIDQSTDGALAEGDYVIVDSSAEGTRRYDLGTKLANMESGIGTISDLQTTSTNLVGAVNELISNTRIKDTYGTYETAVVDSVRNNDEDVQVNGLSDALMAGYSYWDSVGRYTGYTVISESAGSRFTPSNATTTSCDYSFSDDSIVPLTDRVIFLFSESTPTDLSDCYYGRISSVDRLAGTFYVDAWYQHGDTSGTGYLPDVETYQYGFYNLKTHAYGDVCTIDVQSDGDEVLGTVSGRQTNLKLDKAMLNNATMDECVVRSYDSDVNVIGYSVRDTTDSAPVTAFYGGYGVNTIIGSYYVGTIMDRYGARYTNSIYEEDGTTNFAREMVFTYGDDITLAALTDPPRDRHFYLINNSDSYVTVSVSSDCAFRLYATNYTDIRLEAWACIPIYYDYQTSNYNVLVSNVTKNVGVGNWSSVVRVNSDLTLNPANFVADEYKILINYTDSDYDVTVTGYDTYTVPANSHKILYFRDGTTFDFV